MLTDVQIRRIQHGSFCFPYTKQGLAPIDPGQIGLFAAVLKVTEEEVQSVLKEEK